MKLQVVAVSFLSILGSCYEEGEFYEGSRLKFIRAVPRPPHRHISTQQHPPPLRSPLPDTSTTVSSLCTARLEWLPSAWSIYLFQPSMVITSTYHHPTQRASVPLIYRSILQRGTEAL